MFITPGIPTSQKLNPAEVQYLSEDSFIQE